MKRLKLNKELFATNFKELEIYKEIYNINTINCNENVSEDFFNYCLTKKNFLLVIIYDNAGRIFLKEGGINKFCLPGGEILPNETIMNALQRIVKSVQQEAIINDVEPLVFVNNIFSYDGKEVTHNGIVMCARINPKTMHSTFYNITDNIIDKVDAFANGAILEIFKNRLNEIISQNNGDFQDKEIETNQKYHRRYKFHNKFIKKFILTPKVKKHVKLQVLMKEKMKNCRKLIDVSCGDNSLLFTQTSNEEIDFIVANDISWSQIEFIPKSEKILFTNHNAITFPFKESIFDFVYCSNTLHHMPNKKNLCNLLEQMLFIGKKIVIYEIENPETTGGLPYILNKYWYRGFLKDVGDDYLSLEEFQKIINEVFYGRASVKFECFRNIQGNYMIAEITKIS